jgi:spore coat protein CotH
MKIINKPIEMIVQYTEKGEITPVRFRVTIDDNMQAFNVTVITQDTLRIDKDKVLSFRCTFLDGDIKKECELRFNVNTMKWVLYQI